MTVLLQRFYCFPLSLHLNQDGQRKVRRKQKAMEIVGGVMGFVWSGFFFNDNKL